MMSSYKWPIRRSSATLQPVVNSFPVKEYQGILFEQIQGLCIRTASLSRYKFYSISTALLSHHCLKSVKTVITCRFSILQTWFFPTQSFQLLFAHLQLQSNDVRWQSTLSDALILVNSLQTLPFWYLTIQLHSFDKAIFPSRGRLRGVF